MVILFYMNTKVMRERSYIFMISIKEDFELTFDNVNKYLANHPEKAILLSPITEYPFLKGIKRKRC